MIYDRFDANTTCAYLGLVVLAGFLLWFYFSRPRRRDDADG